MFACTPDYLPTPTKYGPDICFKRNSAHSHIHLNPNQYAIGIGKIPILICVVIFLSNSQQENEIQNSDVPKN